ncbi:MAG: hypothetical protein LUG91_00870 [Ruminococcus sp.]|nr:hypothetical protein [Ruminococcus sp.]
MLFISIQSVDLLHLLIRQFKTEQIKVFPDMLRVAEIGVDYNTLLKYSFVITKISSLGTSESRIASPTAR